MDNHILTDPAMIFNQASPKRVVSLVPSLTGSLEDFGLAHTLVGITDFCPSIAGHLGTFTRIGGPKDPRVEQIIALQPDLILANKEENGREAVEALAAAGMPVWLAFPITIREMIQDLWTIANIFRSELAMQQVDLLEKSVEWAEMAASGMPATRYFCPVWEDATSDGTRWWMTFNAQTYPSHVLNLFNGVNIFAERNRRYPLAADLGKGMEEAPGDRDTRYPRVSLAEIIDAQPELILLPDEPFSYTSENVEAIRKAFQETPAAQAGRIFVIDGTWINWCGTRLAQALEELPNVFPSDILSFKP